MRSKRNLRLIGARRNFRPQRCREGGKRRSGEALSRKGLIFRHGFGTERVEHFPVFISLLIHRFFELRLGDVAGFAMRLVDFAHLLFDRIVVKVAGDGSEHAKGGVAPGRSLESVPLSSS